MAKKEENTTIVYGIDTPEFAAEHRLWSESFSQLRLAILSLLQVPAEKFGADQTVPSSPEALHVLLTEGEKHLTGINYQSEGVQHLTKTLDTYSGAHSAKDVLIRIAQGLSASGRVGFDEYEVMRRASLGRFMIVEAGKEMNLLSALPPGMEDLVKATRRHITDIIAGQEEEDDISDDVLEHLLDHLITIDEVVKNPEMAIDVLKANARSLVFDYISQKTFKQHLFNAFKARPLKAHYQDKDITAENTAKQALRASFNKLFEEIKTKISTHYSYGDVDLWTPLRQVLQYGTMDFNAYMEIHDSRSSDIDGLRHYLMVIQQVLQFGGKNK